jgi:hypothetical protein
MHPHTTGRRGGDGATGGSAARRMIMTNNCRKPAIDRGRKPGLAGLLACTQRTLWDGRDECPRLRSGRGPNGPRPTILCRDHSLIAGIVLSATMVPWVDTAGEMAVRQRAGGGLPLTATGEAIAEEPWGNDDTDNAIRFRLMTLTLKPHSRHLTFASNIDGWQPGRFTVTRENAWIVSGSGPDSSIRCCGHRARRAAPACVRRRGGRRSGHVR